ncbi:MULTISPECIES: hypothetical protein [Streptomyces]|uniref:hypothetical protein n=1 Tax=Streptomyces TaxID=1883 RepID=UPI001405578F|nr:hypothetical protein [Streptomyces sp. KM273126]MBA2811562.1 hypothetical protein [Streptomyces sp. KM273126]
MSSQQRDQQQAQTQTSPEADRRREFAKKGALAAIGGAASGLARVGGEVIRKALFGDDT